MKKTDYRQRTTAEKISFSVAVFVLSVIIALLIYSWLNGENSPPVLAVTTNLPIRQVNQQYYVPFKVTNTGGQTAESIEIIAELEREIGTQQIGFLSGGEVEEGAFIFNSDPQRGRLQIRVASYKLP